VAETAVATAAETAVALVVREERRHSKGFRRATAAYRDRTPPEQRAQAASGNGNAGAPVGNNGAGGGAGGNYTINPNGIGSDISGIPVQYGAGRGGAGGYGSGGGSNGGANVNGNPGVTGAVIVAYQIGTSTTREIAQAQAEQEARAAGVEQGKQEGYAQAQEDLQEVVEAGRTALQATVEQDTTKRRRRK